MESNIERKRKLVIEEYNGAPIQKLTIDSVDALKLQEEFAEDPVLELCCHASATFESSQTRSRVFSGRSDFLTKRTFSDFLDHFRITFLANVFLPQGFPNTVSPDYLNYQLWDTIQAFASSQSGALATLATLKGVGVGNEAASVLAASLTWLIKDGVGMISRILFAWAKSNILDADCKRWRLAADALNDLAFCIDLLAPYFPPMLFLAFACTSSVTRSIVGVAGGTTRMSVIRHQARRDNLADVAAKDGSQETLVNVFSLLVSLWLLPLVDGKPLLTWSLFALFVFVHLFANYRAVRSLQLETLNQCRFRIAVRHFIETEEAPSIAYCNSQEPVVHLHNFWRHFGCQLSSIPKLPSSILEHLKKDKADGEFHFLDPQFGVFRSPTLFCVVSRKNNTGWIALDSRASNDDKFSAVFSLEYFSLAGRWPNTNLKIEETNFREKMLQKGWALHTNQLNFDEWRFNLKG